MRVTGTVRTLVASVTMTLAAYTRVLCPECSGFLCSMPGRRAVEPRTISSEADQSGRGIAVPCRRCKSLVEVISHG